MIEVLGAAFSPATQKVLFALEAKAIDYKLTQVKPEDLFNKPESFIKVSPFGLIPIATIEGKTLIESSAICEYLNEVYKNPPLLGKDALETAYIRGITQTIDFIIFKSIFPLIRVESKEGLNNSVAEIRKKFTYLENYVENSRFLCGEVATMADIYFAVIIFLFDILVEFGKLDVLEGYSKLNKIAKEIRSANWYTKIATRETIELGAAFLNSRNNSLEKMKSYSFS